MNRLIEFFNSNRFFVVSWSLTALLAGALVIFALWRTQARTISPAPRPEPTAEISQDPSSAALPQQIANPLFDPGIKRQLQLKTNIPERARTKPVVYRVSRGDAMLAIAEKYNIKSETILYVNKELEDNPHNLRPGMELLIPPADGLYYEWKEGDTLEQVAAKFDANPEDILNFSGNDLDLTDPKFKPGTKVMIPGGSRQLRDWTRDLATVSRTNTGSTGTSEIGGSACGGGPVGSGFGWPANNHTISGNPYGPGHLGIDISANEGDPVYAASSGVVTMAAQGWNYGYGNVIQIDHGNGYVSVYAHLSQINVSVCQPVGQGTLIGLAGNTGNSFGAHLHFEIRISGTNINPLEIVQ
jgi:murein DD-endopeptidase MepM/ murein hydrolase activator NlpD